MPTDGVCCTGLCLFPEWVNRHPAKKVILHRPIEDVNAALDVMQLPRVTTELYHKLDSIKGEHVQWDDMFNEQKARAIWGMVGKPPFEWDKNRHHQLTALKIETRPELRRARCPQKVRDQYRNAGIVIGA